jgi:hypothetical protein
VPSHPAAARPPAVPGDGCRVRRRTPHQPDPAPGAQAPPRAMGARDRPDARPRGRRG